MIIYYLLFCLLVVLCDTSIGSMSRKYLWGMLFLLLLLGLRSKYVGTDTITYINMFTQGKFDVEIEYGFKQWVLFLKYLNDSEAFFIFITSCLQLIPLFHFLRKNSQRISFSLLILLGSNIFFFYLSGLRQAVALTFFLFTVKALIDKRYLEFMFFSIIAGLFHSTAFMFILVCPVLNLIRFNKSVVSILIIISGIIAWFEIFNIEAILNGLGLHELFVGQGVLDRYKGYSEYTVDLNITRTISSKIRTIIIPTLVAYFVNIAIHKYSNYSLYEKLYLSGVIISNILITFPLGFRIGLYGIFFQIIVFPNLIYKVSNNLNLYRLYYLYALVTISFSIKNAYEGITSVRKDIVPYVFFWE